jgi:hypothetical protein
MSKYNIFEFKYGKEKKDIFHYVKLGLLLKGSIDVISLIPGVEKERVFNLVDRLQLSLKIDVLNDYIIKDEELLGYRLKRVVTEAIQEYENEDKSIR